MAILSLGQIPYYYCFLISSCNEKGEKKVSIWIYSIKKKKYLLGQTMGIWVQIIINNFALDLLIHS